MLSREEQNYCSIIYHSPPFVLPLLKRHYAISRFPKRLVRLGRYRNRPDFKQVEGRPSVEESKLWRTSQHSLSKDGPTDKLFNLVCQNEVLLIERQLEMLNIFVGFEQANKYYICNEAGEPLGFIVEEDAGILGVVTRQAFATHRPFRAVIMDLQGSPILWIRRPFAWINPRMFVQRPSDSESGDGEPVLDTFGEVQQVWHPWRRRYDLFLRESESRILSVASDVQPEPPTSIYAQCAKVDSGFLAWDFRLYNDQGEEVVFISRSFRGFGREIFTDTGLAASHL